MRLRICLLKKWNPKDATTQERQWLSQLPKPVVLRKVFQFSWVRQNSIEADWKPEVLKFMPDAGFLWCGKDQTQKSTLYSSLTKLTFPVPADRREAVDQMKDSVSCPGRLWPRLQRFGGERIVDTSSTSRACPMWVQGKTGFPLSFRHSMWHWEHLAS